MKCSHAHARSTLPQYIFTLTLLVTVTLVSTSEASCPTQSTQSTGWPRDSVVRYDVSSLPAVLQTQAIKALNAWTTANSQNNSGVAFVAADSTHPAVLNFVVGQLPTGKAAIMDPNNTNGTITLETAKITINANDLDSFNPSVTSYQLALFKTFLHEIGHTMGLADVPIPNPTAPSARCGDQTSGDSIMNALCGVNDTGGNMPSSLTACDQGTVFQNSQYYRTPCPGTECNDGSGFQVDSCSYPGAGGCPPGYHSVGGCCQPDVPSPILIDTDGLGFHMTSADDGVWFDFYGTGQPIKISWTAAGSTNAWLVLDRNNNDTVDNASEMFGNYTAQPYSADKNGFLALAEFDKSGAGGNEDGRIDSIDVVFSSLQLWIDANHNGISEVEELHSFPELGLKTLMLDYREAKRTDSHGNQFRYRAKVKDTHDAQVGRWAWDVFLVKQ
jgi:hypothetical protein